MEFPPRSTGSPQTITEKDPLGRKLIFAGEVLDVQAHTGGYNITVAFATGHAAGSAGAAAAQALASC